MRKRLAVLGVILGVIFGAIGTTTVAVANHRDCPKPWDPGQTGCDEGSGDDEYPTPDGGSMDGGGTRSYRPIPGGGGGRADASDVNDELALTL